MWVRGLKQNSRDKVKLAVEVAPYVGAWIETIMGNAQSPAREVAPYVGAWIETRKWERSTLTTESRTLCGCVD